MAFQRLFEVTMAHLSQAINSKPEYFPSANISTVAISKYGSKTIHEAIDEGCAIRSLGRTRSCTHFFSIIVPHPMPQLDSLQHNGINVKLPQFTPAVSKEVGYNSRREDENLCRKAQSSQVNKVLLTQRKESKFSTKYDPVPYTVVERKGLPLSPLYEMAKSWLEMYRCSRK